MSEDKKPEMEVRVCVCGCKRTFKCMPTSPSKFYSRSCEYGEVHKKQLRRLLKKASLTGIFEG